MITDRLRTLRLRRRPVAQWAAAFGAILILVALATACSGGSSAPGVANVESAPAAEGGSSGDDGSASNGEAEPDALAFAQCMRENGVPDFPDPPSAGGGGGALSINPNSPQFQAAREACQQYSPQGGDGGEPPEEVQQAALEFAQCMRDQGITNFPDPPDPQDGGGSQLNAGQLGIDLDSPQFQAAQETCSQYLPNGGEPVQSGGGVE